MNRLQFQALADIRIGDANALIVAGCWSGAYYMAGYAVECGLKACIAKLTNQHDFPDKKFALECFTHNIEDLVRSAGLRLPRDQDCSADASLSRHWLIVRDWDEKSRYQAWSEFDARKLVVAVTEPNHGVLPWIMAHW